MTFGILGSGFGLYGYLPALVNGLGEKRVVMPARYREKLLSRPSERQFDDAVIWVAQDEDVLTASTALILAKRPADQLFWAERALSCPDILGLVLEKPIAPMPEAAASMLAQLDRSGKTVRIGFTFAHTRWARDLAPHLATHPGPLRFEWRFRAHHLANSLETWKRHPSQGGGVLNFFGIHHIALLASYGYSSVHSSRLSGAPHGDATRWEASFSGAGLPECSALVDIDSCESVFSVVGDGFSVKLRDPFELEQTEGPLDRRVPLLTEVCRPLVDGIPHAVPSWYQTSVVLWSSAYLQAEALRPIVI